MPTHSYTSALLEAKSIAIYGLKRNGKGFAHEIAKGLKKFNPECVISAVRPDGEKIAGFPVVESVCGLIPTPDIAFIILRPEQANTAIADIQNSKLQQVWLVMNAASRKNIRVLGKQPRRVITGCPLLYMTGTSFPHNLHRWLARTFNKI